MSQDENNIRAESAAQVELILQNLRDLLDYEEVQVDQVVLAEMISKFEALAASFKQINVGVFGDSGSGKSTLLNRILGCEILPALSSGVSCTNTIFKIRKRAALGEKFEVVFHYFTLANISTMILPDANNSMEEDEDGGRRGAKKPSPAVQLAEEILDAFWEDEAVPESEDLKELIPSKFYDILSRPEKRKEKHSFDSANDAWEFIDEKTREKGLPFVLKEIEVLGNFPGLHEQVCLLDIPGSGDTVFLRQVQNYGLEQSDLVVIAEKQARVSNRAVLERLTLPASYLTKKVGLAFCMTHAGKGYEEICLRATKRTKTEAPNEVVDVEQLGREYVDKQKQQFRDALKKFSPMLAEQLKGMEMFTLENAANEGSEPVFSQAEWEKFTTFLNQMVHNREVWDLIAANVRAAIEDAEARLKAPPITSLSKDCIAEIQAVFQGEEAAAAEPIKFALPLEQDIPEINLSAVKSASRYYATLKSAAAPDCITYYPDIPIWSHVVSSALNLPAITKSNLAFQMVYIQAIEQKLEKVKPVLEKYLGGNGGGNGGKVNFCLNRLRVFLVQRLNENLESSTRMFKHGKLERSLTKKFWEHVPTVSTGKGMVAKNAQAINTFLKNHFREMRDFLQEKVGRKFRTLDQSLVRVSEELEDLKKWLEQQPSEDAQVRGGLELISIALKAEKKVESDQDEDASSSTPADTPKAFVRKLRELDVELQALFPNDCKQVKNVRLCKPANKPSTGWFYLASTNNPMDDSIFIGWGPVDPRQGNLPISLLGEALHSNAPQLCFRLMRRAFPPSDVPSPNKTKLAKVIADKDVAASVAHLVCAFVEKVYGDWGFN